MSYPYAPPPAPPPARQPWAPGGCRYGLGTVLGAAALAALVAGVTGLGTGALLTWAVTGEGAAPSPGRPAAQVLPQRLPGLVSWVEQRVGVDFSTPPDVEVLDDAAFDRVLLSPSDGAGEPQSSPEDDYSATVHALGLVPDVGDYEAFSDSGFASGVLGFYDPGTERLVVRGSQWSPVVEVTVVHELVHALQDQVVDLDAVTSATHLADETYLALSAVLEGQATVVEEDWLLEQGLDYEDEYWAGLDAGYADDAGAFDAFAAAMAYLPYDLGWLAVSDLEAAEGPEATLEVLAAPPTTTEQLYDVEGWREGAPAAADPVAVPEPDLPRGAQLVDSGTVGVHVLGLLPMDPDDWPMATEEDTLDGWAGDRYVTYTLADTGGELTCTRVAVRLDDTGAATDLVDALTDWTGADRTAVATGDRVDLQACVDD